MSGFQLTRKNWNLQEYGYPLLSLWRGSHVQINWSERMESFCKVCSNAKMKISFIKASTFHLIFLDIPRNKFIDYTLSNTRSIMTLNYRLAKVHISQQFGRFQINCDQGCKFSCSVSICPLIGLAIHWWFEPSMV